MNRVIWSASVLIISTLLLGTSVAQAMSAKIVSYQSENASNFDRSLTLEVNNKTIRFMLNPSYVTARTKVVGSQGQANRHENKAFTGIVEDEKNSWVRITMTRTHLSGVFSRHGNRYEIDTDRLGNITISPLADNQSHNAPQNALQTRSALATVAPQVTRVADIGIVVDSQYNNIFRGNGLDKALSIINAVDGIYREEFGLGLRVTKVVNILDANNDPLNYGPVPIEQMLRNFRFYRMNSDDFNDVSLVHLFSGNANTDEPVGLAWINTACRADGYDVGISTPYRHDVLLAAHEIAHNLGAQHDSDTACATQDDKVMWPYISSNTSQYFSSCTLESVNASLQNSCHIETIDLQVSLQQSTDDTITATVKNNDYSRANNSAVLSIDLPENSIATALEGDCTIPDIDLKCDIGTLLPGAEETIVVQFGQIDELSATVHFSVANEDTADPQPLNNLVAMNITNGTITALNAQPSSPIFLDAGIGGNSGAGAISASGILVLLGFGISRRRKTRIAASN